MKRIVADEYCTLHLRGGDVLVDFVDVHLLAIGQLKWAVIDKNGNKYAVAHVSRGGFAKHIHMHQLLLWFPKDGVVDHINRNSLDNRRSNLRIITSHENWSNSGPRKNGKVKYKGVSPHRDGFRATIQVHGRWKQIGVYDTAEDAARAYDKAAFAAHGAAAYLNRSEFAL